MAKTSISMDETNDICQYFVHLKNKYKIKNSQLYNNCDKELSDKTIAKYTSGNPTNAISYTTLTILVDSFAETLKMQGISCPTELSTEFLISSRLHPFLESLALKNDPDSLAADTPCNAIDSPIKKQAESEQRVITCDPTHNNCFIAFLFGLGGSITLCTVIFNLIDSQIHLEKLSFIGLIFLSAAINLAMPKLKQSIEVNPRSRLFYAHSQIWSNISQSIVFILMLVAKPLLYISLFGLLVCKRLVTARIRPLGNLNLN